MYIGKYYHKLEPNGRVMIPKAFRKADSHVITRGLDGSLFLFTNRDFELEIDSIRPRSFTKKINRDFIRLLTNEAQNIDTDKSGRIQIPNYLVEYAKLKKDIVFVGSMNRVEIWDLSTYHLYLSKIELDAENIAEKFYETEI